jgi:hypothetical protein
MDEKLKKASMMVLKAAARQLELFYLDDKDLLERAIHQDGLVLDIMLGFYQERPNCPILTVIRFHEGESLTEITGVGDTLEAAIDSAIQWMENNPC